MVQYILLWSFRTNIYKQSLDEIFAISRIIKVEVTVISWRLRLKTLTETLIILDITKTECVVPENIHTPPTEGFLVWTPLPPLWKFHISLILSFKKQGFWNPPPPWNSSNLPWGGHGYFLELHNLIIVFLYIQRKKMEVMFLLLHWRQAAESVWTWHRYP